jgi:Rieske Fe-S protein
MQEPYHYFRSHEIDGQKYLIVGGEDHKTGHDDPEQAFANLEAYANQHYQIDSVAYKWSSQYYVPADGLPYIGRMAASGESIYMATGFNGNGMMFGTLSAKIISDQILGIENRYSELYSPSRLKPIAGFTDFVKENADVAWHFIADRFGAEEIQALSELKKGAGRVAELQGSKFALYKDTKGKVTALSPVCTHAGCIVNFNAAEQSWDLDSAAGERRGYDGETQRLSWGYTAGKTWSACGISFIVQLEPFSCGSMVKRSSSSCMSNHSML